MALGADNNTVLLQYTQYIVLLFYVHISNSLLGDKCCAHFAVFIDKFRLAHFRLGFIYKNIYKHMCNLCYFVYLWSKLHFQIDGFLLNRINTHVYTHCQYVMLEIGRDIHACYCAWEFDKFIDLNMLIAVIFPGT